jgi:hypothetical protein
MVQIPALEATDCVLHREPQLLQRLQDILVVVLSLCDWTLRREIGEPWVGLHVGN